MSDFGLYIEVKRTNTVLVTRLCEGKFTDGAYHVQTDDMSGRIDVRCLAHNVVVRGITPAQAESVDDSLSFCQMCMSDEPAIERKTDPLVEMLRGMLDSARGDEDDTLDDDEDQDDCDDDPPAPVAPARRNVFAEFINSL